MMRRNLERMLADYMAYASFCAQRNISLCQTLSLPSGNSLPKGEVALGAPSAASTFGFCHRFIRSQLIIHRKSFRRTIYPNYRRLQFPFELRRKQSDHSKSMISSLVSTPRIVMYYRSQHYVCRRFKVLGNVRTTYADIFSMDPRLLS